MARNTQNRIRGTIQRGTPNVANLNFRYTNVVSTLRLHLPSLTLAQKVQPTRRIAPPAGGSGVHGEIRHFILDTTLVHCRKNTYTYALYLGPLEGKLFP
jgi:hypothetical protein